MALKPEAFDYLDLPFAIVSGSVGRVSARVSGMGGAVEVWRRFHARVVCFQHTTTHPTQIPWRLPGRLPIELEFAGVRAVAAPRPEGDWSARAASDRAASAARAQLAAAEAALLAALTAGGSATDDRDRGDRGGGGGLAGLVASAAGAALGRLALTVSDVHLRFEGLPDGAGGVRAAAGLLVASVSTDGGGGGGDAAFAKAFLVQGACVYWTPAAPPPGRAPPSHPPCAASDVVLGPLAARVRVAVGGGAGPRARLSVAVGEAAAAARPAALAGAAAALDAATVWRLRRDGAPWRPAGWRDGRGGGGGGWGRPRCGGMQRPPRSRHTQATLPAAPPWRQLHIYAPAPGDAMWSCTPPG